MTVLSLTFPRAFSTRLQERQPAPPRELREVIGYAPLVLPDGTIEHYYTRGEFGSQAMMSIRSTNRGETWSNPSASCRCRPRESSRDARRLHCSTATATTTCSSTTRQAIGRADVAHAAERGRREVDAVSDRLPKGPSRPPIQLKSGRIVIQTGPFEKESPPGTRCTASSRS